MANKTKKYHFVKEVTDNNGDKRTILVYAEVSECNYLTGIAPVLITRKGREVKAVGDAIYVDNNCEYRSPLRVFNMGWALCHNMDKFDLEKGIKKAKTRFAKSPMKTQNPAFLNKDMVYAILSNEADYIAEHMYTFMKRAKQIN